MASGRCLWLLIVEYLREFELGLDYGFEIGDDERVGELELALERFGK